MKTKKEVLERIVETGGCSRIRCTECGYTKVCRVGKNPTLGIRLQKIGAMAILKMFTEKKKPILEIGTKIKFSKIDTSKYNIDENGNVLRNETLIKPWQQNMIELLEKNECLEKEIVRLKKLLKNYQEQAICNGFCKNCKHIGNKTLCKECGINNYLWELAE